MTDTSTNKSTTLDDVKLLLGLVADTSQDSLLNLIIKHTEAQLRLKLHLKTLKGVPAEIPPELSFIVTEVSVRRFNRIGDEGKTAGTQDGLSATWATNDFDDFSSDIDTWLDDAASTPASFGHASFINPYGGSSEGVR